MLPLVNEKYQVNLFYSLRLLLLSLFTSQAVVRFLRFNYSIVFHIFSLLTVSTLEIIKDGVSLRKMQDKICLYVKMLIYDLLVSWQHMYNQTLIVLLSLFCNKLIICFVVFLINKFDRSVVVMV